MSQNSFEHWNTYIEGGRDKHSRPLANNTRVERRGSDCIAIRLHATDVVSYMRDGRVILNTGGWRTNTTKDRINGYSPANVYAVDAIWYVHREPNPNDPKPPYVRRSVSKPFHALDPGPEPIKGTEGCLAGSEERETAWEDVFIGEGERLDSDLDSDRDSYGAGYIYVQRSITTITRYVEGHPSYVREVDGCLRTVEKRCPHCALFDRQHDAWDAAMNGDRYGRDGGRGYRQMNEALALYGDRDAWQDAYITDYRAARASAKLRKEWEERNTVQFFDGIEIDEQGYVTNAPPTEGQVAHKAEIDKLKRTISKFVKLCCDELAAGNVPMPSAGDCWYCGLTKGDGVPIGDAMDTIHADGSMTVQPSHGHLHDHIEEGYVVPSMLVNALRERGYRDAGIYIFLGVNPEEGTMGGRISRDIISRALRAYLQSRLVPDSSGSTPSGAKLRQSYGGAR